MYLHSLLLDFNIKNVLAKEKKNVLRFIKNMKCILMTNCERKFKLSCFIKMQEKHFRRSECFFYQGTEITSEYLFQDKLNFLWQFDGKIPFLSHQISS